ncbi:MAG: aminotransferase class III-fold pyridoxal phosphate-dependent enzyme [Actinobacteria bacterium]|nr:aminotransferase class III-fold pyridoxal phosphate-dependent enzyme [Actinomycetota bacterium]
MAEMSDRSNLLLHFTANGAYGPGGSELLVLERGEGPYVFDTDGRRYVDGLSSLFCSQIGYSYGEEMAAAAAAQLGRLSFNTNWATAHPPAIELASALVERAPAGMAAAFFTSGGSESVEAAWKMARQYHLANGEPQRTKAIARDIAYHGVTLGALSFTGVPRFKEPFGRPAIDTRHVSNTNSFRSPLGGEELTTALLEELDRAIEEEGPDQVAIVIAEPIQNAGGCLVAPPGYWQGVRQICDRYGILLIADEVIAGCGRLGRWFASDHYGIRPDLITIAKGLTSAYAPMGAVIAGDRVAEALRRPGVSLLHGITFGGHPLCAAIALQNVEIFERDGVLENVRRRGSYLRDRLEQKLRPLPIVGDLRGDGFFFAAEMTPDGGEGRFESDQVARLVREIVPRLLLERGLIARADDRGDPVLQIAPPLISDDAVLDEVVDAMRDVLAAAGDEIGLTA